MNKILCLITAALVASLCSLPLCAGKRSMGIEEMLRLADAGSANLQSSRIAVAVAEAGIADAKAARLPDISATASVSYLGDGHIWDRDFSNGKNAAMPHFGNNFALKATQALYTGGEITTRIAMATTGRSLAENRYIATRGDLHFMLIGYYLQLATLSNEMRVYDANIALTGKVIEQMRVRLRQGTALKNDITRYELQLEELRLQRTRVADNMAIANHRMATLMSIGGDIEIVPDSTLCSTLPEKYSESHWQAEATAHATTLKQASLNEDMTKQQEQLQKSARLPKVAIVAENHLDGPITIEVPALNNNFNYWFVGVGVSYNISSLYKNNKKIRQAAIASSQARQESTVARENVENDVQAAYTTYLTSFTELATRLKSEELARQNYKVVNDRYNGGIALITDMTDAANIKLTAELELVNARINVLFSYYKMLYVCGTL